jgi:hypothetical protein
LFPAPLSSPRREKHASGDHTAGDLAGGEIRRVSDAPLPRVANTWGRVDPGAQPSADLGYSRGVRVAFRVSVLKRNDFPDLVKKLPKFIT